MSGGTLPSSPAPAAVIPRSSQPTRASRSHSLRLTTRTRGPQMWAFRFTYAPMTRAQWAPLYAFLLSQRGQADRFNAVVPILKTPLGTWPGAPVVDGAGQTSATVAIRGLTASQAGAAKAGDIIKFAGHSKVYMLTQDASSDGAGKTSINFQPQLIAAIADGEALTVSSVPFTVILASDNLDSAIAEGANFKLEFDLVEAF